MKVRGSDEKCREITLINEGITSELEVSSDPRQEISIVREATTQEVSLDREGTSTEGEALHEVNSDHDETSVITEESSLDPEEGTSHGNLDQNPDRAWKIIAALRQLLVKMQTRINELCSRKIDSKKLNLKNHIRCNSPETDLCLQLVNENKEDWKTVTWYCGELQSIIGDPFTTEFFSFGSSENPDPVTSIAVRAVRTILNSEDSLESVIQVLDDLWLEHKFIIERKDSNKERLETLASYDQAIRLDIENQNNSYCTVKQRGVYKKFITTDEDVRRFRSRLEEKNSKMAVFRNPSPQVIERLL